jgi:ABC-type amino acid transport substrate-binding protein
MRAAWFIVLLTLALAPLASAQSDDVDAETLKVCTYNNPPFFFQENGKYGGFEHDILESFAERLGLELEVVWRQRPQSTTRLESLADQVSECDVLANTLTHTPEREQQADFSAPYFQVIVTLVEPQGQHSASLEELSGKRVTTIRNTAPHAILAKNPEIEVVFVSSRDALFELVVEGEADATAWDSWVVAESLDRYPQLRITGALSEIQYLAFCLPKGSPLKAKLDAHIRKLQKSGAFQSMLADHFGEENAELIADALSK